MATRMTRFDAAAQVIPSACVRESDVPEYDGQRQLDVRRFDEFDCRLCAVCELVIVQFEEKLTTTTVLRTPS